jgi:integrase
MSELRQAFEEYLALRRSLGARLRGVDSALRKFVTFVESEGSSYITTDLALRWAMQSHTKEPATWASRLQMVRGFAVWHSANDPRTDIPPKGLLPHRYRRKPPYIYTDGEIEKLLLVARDLPCSTGLRGATYSTLFGLLAVTGMRLNEALALDRDDVDLDEGLLTIRMTKFRKSRLVPIHESTCEMLADYADDRDRIVRRPATAAFFVSQRGTRITQWAAEYTFAKVSRNVGLRAPVKGRRHGHGPRLHDMRHRFVARTLVDWYRAGIDVEREIPKLATYLGHVHANETYWYLEAVPELLELATQRLVKGRKEIDP